MAGHDIIVIGTSAGGVGALQSVLSELPPGLAASVFIVIHLSPHIPSRLAEVLAKSSRLPVRAVTAPTRFRKGQVYLASPDHHLLLGKTKVELSRGPRENWHRPSIDVLFRSAAEHHGPRVIGVVLTGALDDGTAGLSAVKREGGIAVVQDPEDALFPDMPANAMDGIDVDHVLPLAGIGPALADLVRSSAGRRPRGRLSREAAIEKAIVETTMKGLNGREALDKAGERSTFTCPECQGPMWELKDGRLIRLRCQVGHAFTGESMLIAQQDVVERALWVALGAIESRVALWRRMSNRLSTPHLQNLAAFYRAKEQDAERDMEVLRQLLTENRESRRIPRERTRGARGRRSRT